MADIINTLRGFIEQQQTSLGTMSEMLDQACRELEELRELEGELEYRESERRPSGSWTSEATAILERDVRTKHAYVFVTMRSYADEMDRLKRSILQFAQKQPLTAPREITSNELQTA